MHGGASAADFGGDIETVWLRMQQQHCCVSVLISMFPQPKWSPEVDFVGTRRAHSSLTLKFMLALLGEPGFRDIKRVQEFGLFDDSSTLTIGDVSFSLNVETWK